MGNAQLHFTDIGEGVMRSGVITYLKALRGSRGFGIHSPFAFEFVLNVLRDRHPFYAYEELKRRY
ncbi:MAG: hypothetical protein K2M98_07820, partial [Muribaculum sp.]|nr:hypothetical protein [Muribaculum sp.]